jgi:hypothetical protein
MSWLQSAYRAPRRLWSAVTRPVPRDAEPQRPKFDAWAYRREHPRSHRLDLVMARVSFWRRQAWLWQRQHWLGTLILCAVLVVVMWVHARGMYGWPGLINFDEGVYMQQAWSVSHLHRLMPGSYTYDHPYFGWTMIAGVTTATQLFLHPATAVIAGRQFMLAVQLASSVFVYLLARRLKMNEVFAGCAVLLFSLSPLALEYQRLVFLDNMALMWLIIAMWCLMSPRRGTTAASWAGICMGLSFMCKETFTVPMVAILLMLFDYRARNWVERLLCCLGYAVLTVGALYLVYAIAKSELLPGTGHVSLIGTAEYQLFNRAGTGSLLDPRSGTYRAAMVWLHQDLVILGGGTAAAVVAMFSKRMRAVAFSLVIQVLAMCRNGYLPFAYATALFPFAALALTGVADRIWRQIWPAGKIPDRRKWLLGLVVFARTATITAGVLSLVVLSNGWRPQLTAAMDAQPNLASMYATDYAVQHIGRQAVIVTNDDSFTDLAERGFHPISEFKPDNDPAVKAQLPEGWSDINWLLLGSSESVQTLRSLQLPTVALALQHAHKIKTFAGGIVLYKVVKP